MTDALPTPALAWEYENMFNTSDVDSDFRKQQQQLLQHQHQLLDHSLHSVPAQWQPTAIAMMDSTSASSSMLFAPHSSSFLPEPELPQQHASPSCHSSHSRSSSPFSSLTSSEAPLESPSHGWVEEGGAISEEDSISGGASGSGAMQAAGGGAVVVGGGNLAHPASTHNMLLLPTINEHLSLGNNGGGVASRKQSAGPFDADCDELPNMQHLMQQAPPQAHIGMLQPSMPLSSAILDNTSNHVAQQQQQQQQHMLMMMQQQMQQQQMQQQQSLAQEVASTHSSNPSTPSDRVHVHAKRRTRYTTAAAASVAARDSLVHTNSVSSSGSLSSSSSFVPISFESQSQHNSCTSAGSSDNEQQQGSTGAKDDEEEEVINEEEDDEEDYTSKKGASKRKRGGNGGGAASKSNSSHGSSSPPVKGGSVGGEGLDKRERNKLSASMYRKRRKVYLDSLEGKVGELDSTISKQGETIAKQAAENKALKEQLNFFKKIVNQLNPALIKDAPMMAPAAAAANSQPSNVHHRGARNHASSAASFLLVVLSCVMLCNTATFMDFSSSSLSSSSSSSASSPAATPAAAGGMETGRRGRSLLSIEVPAVPSMPSVASSIELTSAVSAEYDVAFTTTVVVEDEVTELAASIESALQIDAAGSKLDLCSEDQSEEEGCGAIAAAAAAASKQPANETAAATGSPPVATEV